MGLLNERFAEHVKEWFEINDTLTKQQFEFLRWSVYRLEFQTKDQLKKELKKGLVGKK
jgi:hypothetical protein